jgi:tRNA(Ile2) C34 agmatinyltransferase TiaS
MPITCLQSLRPVVAVLALAVLAGCATTATGPGLVVGQQASIEGQVLRVDTNPWAYDGNAVVAVSSATAGEVEVQLPARWNLCKAAAPEGVQELKPGDRVQATGTVAEAKLLVVCAEPQHRLRKLP